MARRWPSLLLLLCALLQLSSRTGLHVCAAAAPQGTIELEGFEEEEEPSPSPRPLSSDHQRPSTPQPSHVDGFEPGQPGPEKAQPPQATPSKAAPKPAPRPAGQPSGRRPSAPYIKPLTLANYAWEVLALALCAAFSVRLYQGKKANENLALAWARTFLEEGGVLERNFTLLGPGDNDRPEVLMRESQNSFKVWASGRRYCTGALISLDLRRRQDLTSLVTDLFWPADDLMHMEVYMTDAMPPVVLAIAPPKQARALQREFPSLEELAHPVTVSRDRLPGWPVDRLTVLAEASGLFYDIINEGIAEQVFSMPAFATQGKLFRYLHFTSEGMGDRKNVLRFSFSLPPASRMGELTKLLNAAMVLVDVVGSLKLTPDQRKRAEARRAERDVRNFKDEAREREERLREKKAAEKQAEKDKLKTLSADARQKVEEKQKRLEAKRFMRKHTRYG